MRTGAVYSGNSTYEFVVWAPHAESVLLKITAPSDEIIPMRKNGRGYWKTVLQDVRPGTSYVYRLDNEKERPDPSSYYQPHGVHEASQVINHSSFAWRDSDWKGVPLREMIMYEIHVGTFTPEGTFDAAISRLEEIGDTGINAIEIMPVAQFPGERNWGYDGVYPYAVQNSYGGPEGLKRFVDQCHARGMAVILDVVYNHLGPEGNYLWDYGPYFTDRYQSPWGDAINFDGPQSKEVRDFFIENALYWFEHYHIDALRLDAIHGIYDKSGRHILAELSERVEAFSGKMGRTYLLIAESDLNDPAVARPRQRGGYGIDGIWNDDFHHAVHTLLAREESGYYVDFGTIEHLVKSLREGYVYTGQYSGFRKKRHGSSSKDIPADRIVVFSQNHDQVGNRMMGERISHIVPFEARKLAAGIVLLSPYVPLLFMGEEYGESAPFLYFVSHSDPGLIEGIREGRKKDFESFNWKGDPPDPQDAETFNRSVINWNVRGSGDHKIMLEFYKELVRLRKSVPALANLDKQSLDISFDEEKKVVFIRRWKDNSYILALFNFSSSDMRIDHISDGRQCGLILDSSGAEWNGPGSLLPKELKQDRELILRANSLALYENIIKRSASGAEGKTTSDDR